jgi:hypothetical protein
MLDWRPSTRRWKGARVCFFGLVADHDGPHHLTIRHTSSRPCTMDEMSEEVGAAGYATAAEAGASQPATSGEWNSSFGASMRRRVVRLFLTTFD